MLSEWPELTVVRVRIAPLPVVTYSLFLPPFYAREGERGRAESLSLGGGVGCGVLSFLKS